MTSPPLRTTSVLEGSVAEGRVDSTPAPYLTATLSFLSSLAAAGAVMSPLTSLSLALMRMISLVLPYS